MFKCGFCGKEYETIEGRMECEKQCKQNELKKQADAKRTEDKIKREADYKELVELTKQRDGIQKKIDEIYERYNCRFTSLPSFFSSLDPFRGW